MTAEHSFGQAGSDDNALLAGACELAMLEDAWEHFVKHPAFNYLFVIDAPKITSIHALPPQNIAQFGITGLLASPDRPFDLFGRSFEDKQKHYLAQAREYPLTVGMTEILARYLFTTRWSAGNPKLIMASQWQSINRILEAVETTSIEELRRSLDSATRNGALDRLRERMAASSSPERLLDEVLDRLPDLMPAVYGAYTATRQLFRYMEVLPLDARGNMSTVFADSYAVIHDILENSQAVDSTDPMSLISLEQRWRDCIPTRQDRAMLAVRFPGLVRPGSTVHLENARTFAEIEYINRKFRANGQPHRLAFVTTTGRLFSAALTRFARDGVGQEYVQMRREAEGTRDSYRKFRYYVRLLEPDDDDISMLPLVDPRMLMTSPDFINFANNERGHSADDSSRAISAWIPLFFEFLRADGGAGLDIQRLFDLYRRIVVKAQGLQRVDTRELLTLTQGIDPIALKNHWSNYVGLISAAETSSRLVKADAELRAALLAANSGPDQLRDVVNRRLNETMSQWLSSLSNVTIDSALRQRADHPADQRASAHFERMPALLLPMLQGCALSQDQLAALFEDVSRPLGPHEALAERIALGTARTDADALHEIKARYVQILGQAYIFGMLGHWDSVQVLTMQAFALAENFLADEPAQHENTYVSGREAAFLAAVSRRRLLLNSGSPEMQEEALLWLDKFRAALVREMEKYEMLPVQHQLLQERVSVEDLAWQLQDWLQFLYRRDTVVNSARSFHGAGPEIIVARADNIASACEQRLLELERSALEPGLREAYSSVAQTLYRDVAVMALQVHLLAPKVSRTSPDRLRRHLRVLGADQTLVPFPVPGRIAGIEREVIFAARRKLGEQIDGMPRVTDEEAQRLDPFDRWRLILLRRSVGESVPS